MPLCECGCEGSTQGGSFLPGHDQRLRSSLEAKVGGLLGLRTIIDCAERYQQGEISEQELGRVIRAQFATEAVPTSNSRSRSSCREQILEAAGAVMAKSGLNHFSIPEIIAYLASQNTRIAESTIRTHIVSRMCVNAPENHAVTYRDLLRTDLGEYKLLPLSSKE